MAKFTISRLVGGLLLALGLMFVVPGVASATVSAAPSPAIVAVAPSTIAPGGQAVSISGSGLPARRTGVITECSSAFPQPTVAVRGVPTPVSCSTPLRVHIGPAGALFARFHVVDGKVGPPVGGIDSAGRWAGINARSYPCAPTAAQVAAGAYCYLLLSWGRGAGDQRMQPLAFAATATSVPPTVTPKTTTSTTPLATHHTVTVVTMKPVTDLTSGRAVDVIATGLPHSGAGDIMECSSATPQPTITVAGVRIPVSCTDPAAKHVTFTSHGDLRTSFSVVTGIVGPPAQGTDNSGHSAAAQAKKFPCPPTAAQATAGAHCYLVLVWGTGVHDRSVHAITFAATTPKTTTTTTTKPVTTAAKTTPTPTAHPTSSGGTLPFTGASIDQMALAGIVLVLVGAGLLLMGEVPRGRKRRRGYATTPVETG